MIAEHLIKDWNKAFETKSPVEVLTFFLDYFKEKISLSTSLGIEDQILTHMLSTVDPNAHIFTLDTGRLFPETYDLINTTSRKYNVHIEVFFPESYEVEHMVSEKGINLFYDSISNRKLCCYVRKLKPLSRALKGKEAWITGIRQNQSITRNDIKLIQWDKNNEILKINPLINWTEEELNAYIKEHRVPINPLHRKGFTSIGCQPCTRAITNGEDVRAGRWWWENPETKECGLHQH